MEIDSWTMLFLQYLQWLMKQQGAAPLLFLKLNVTNTKKILRNSTYIFYRWVYGIFLTCSLSPCDLTVCTYVIQSITAILVSVDAACQVNQDGILTNTTKTADVFRVNGVIEGCMFDLMVIVWSGDKRTDIHWTLTK